MSARLRRSSSRGVTIIEIVMAMGVLAVGTSGIIAMQKVTVVANRDARNIETANEIARTWIERLRADAAVWNHPSGLNSMTDLDETVWLNGYVRPQNAPAWVRPENAKLKLYGVHDALGRDDPSGQNLDGPFCVNLRLTWHRPNRSMRAEVRVYWLRQGIQGTTKTVPNPLCGATPNNPPNVQYDTDLYHFVQATTLINQNMAL